MIARFLLVTLLASSLLGSSPVPAPELEAAADTSSSVSLAHAAIVSSTVGALTPLRALDSERPQVALPVLFSAPPAVARFHRSEVAPAVFAALPDVVTCPAQGPPVRS